jgi:hypothetical protein
MQMNDWIVQADMSFVGERQLVLAANSFDAKEAIGRLRIFDDAPPPS